MQRSRYNQANNTRSNNRSSQPNRLRYEFQTILELVDPNRFACYRLNREKSSESPPAAEEATAHLLFLKALGSLKDSILLTRVYQGDELVSAEKIWQVYVSNAVRRFIKYLEFHRALYSSDQNEEELYLRVYFTPGYRRIHKIHRVTSMLPPLDILMVWHSFMLNPRSFYDTFARNKMLLFVYIPFPLLDIVNVIDHVSFKYEPPRHAKQIFANFAPNLPYEVDVDALFLKSVPIFCPICFHRMGMAPWTTASNNGFADQEFQLAVEKHPCTVSGHSVSIPTVKLSHSILRNLQLIADMQLYLPMPNIYLKFSTTINSETGISDRWKNSLLQIKDRAVKTTVQRVTTPLINGDDYIQTFHFVPPLSRFLYRIITRDYNDANLIQLTFHKSQGNKDVFFQNPLGDVKFNVIEDLVSCVLRQGRFIEKMNNIDWLHSPLLRETMKESRIRYSRFLNLLVTQNLTLVPTLDIDLFWHTHQLSFYSYLKSSRGKDRRLLIDHNDKLLEGYLAHSFIQTTTIYNKIYKEDYSLCLCWLCVRGRCIARSKGRVLQKWSKPTLEEEKKKFDKKYRLSSLGLAHVSDHNVVVINLTETGLQEVQNTLYIKNGGKLEYPWGEYYWEGYPKTYVVNPVAPFGTYEGCLWDASITDKRTCGAAGRCGRSGARTCAAIGACTSGAGVCGGSGGCGDQPRSTGGNCGSGNGGGCAGGGGGCGGGGSGGGSGDGGGTGGCGGGCGGGGGGCGGGCGGG